MKNRRLAIFAIVLMFAGCQPEEETKPAIRQFDRNDVSEENRRLVRDKMIENGTSPADAEAFTQELYKAEREHRRKNGSNE
jgi:hypothetical protein